MARRSTLSSSSSSSARKKSQQGKEIQPAQCIESSVVSKLQMLRDFLGKTTKWTEGDLSSCLRQCGYNVELAAERLMTGQFQGSNPFSINKGRRKSSFFAMSGSSSSPSKIATETAKPATNTAASSAVKRPLETPQTARKKATRASSGSVNVVTPAITTLSSTAKSSSSNHSSCNNTPLLLCQRWVVGCCTTRHGHVSFKERLNISNSLNGPPVVRFRGYSIDGTLPANLGAMLTPLLRYSKEIYDNEKESAASSFKLISIKAEGLMEARQVPIGGEVPLSLSIYLEAPLEFFEIFGQEKEKPCGSASAFFGRKSHFKSSSSGSKMLLSEAAFHLLQWAEYGDVPQFTPPTDSKHQTDQESPAKADEEPDDVTSLVVLREEEMDTNGADDDDYTAEENKFSGLLAKNSDDDVASLPEMDDPLGFTGDVVLRSYQRQALHWMMNRELNSDHRGETEKELSFLKELAQQNNSFQRKIAGPNGAVERFEDILCECSPVIVSEAAAKRSKTLDGQVNPVNHPLWQRRFLASADKSDVISFYVNELLGTATHKLPNPPRPCVGGILADSMGLGKTVMLLALILKEKEEAAINNRDTGATLIVAPLSLVAQWEEELSTKTNLTFSVHYGDKTKTTFGPGHSLEVEVVISTYGTIQAERQTRSKKTSSGLLDYEWHRVILDEAQCIKNQATLACKACCMLSAERRWCVSGTIIQNSLDDVYALLKFLRHEPWCESGFWKTAVTSVMRLSATEKTNGSEDMPAQDGLVVAMDRVRRLLVPIMLRRTKDSLDKDGKPILTLPPVETLVVQVEFSPAEREFYNSLLLKSQDVFEGFLKAGTASKSWLAIFSLLHRLRQACDHVALTVKSHIDDSAWNASRLVAEDKGESTDSGSSEAVSDVFLQELLQKFRSKQLVANGKEDPAEELSFHQSVAKTLTDAVNNGETRLSDECSICLEMPLIEEAVVTPCAHVFCRACLSGYLPDKCKTVPSEDGNKSSQRASPNTHAPCPYCQEIMDVSQVVALSKSSNNDFSTSRFWNDKTSRSSAQSVQTRLKSSNHHPTPRSSSPREFLEQSLRGAGSSKLSAVVQELHHVWKQDPGSKVLIFSQFLGFLDLLEGALRENDISFGRLDGSMSLKERVVVLEQFKSQATASTNSLSLLSSSSSSTDHPNNNSNENSSKSVASAVNNRGSVLLISMKAGGVGINLVAASTVFVVDPWWNAAVEDQCVNRIHRIGQTAKVVRVRKFVVVDSVEERIVELQRRKKGIANQVFGEDNDNSGDDDEKKDPVAAASAAANRPTLDDFKLIFGKKS